MFRRFAIYYTPPEDSALARFGVAWLGWDIARGVPVAPPGIEGLPAPLEEITATPRRYGLHATIRPPFALAAGQRGEDLHAALAALCARMAPVPLTGLELVQMGRFLALLARGPESAQTGLSVLAAQTVRSLDGFRAPLDAADLARRRQAGLTPRQEVNLARWGYPHVMEDFRFHITLSGKRPHAETAAIRAALMPHVAEILAAPLVIDALSLVGEDAAGRFHVIARIPLAARGAPHGLRAPGARSRSGA